MPSAALQGWRHPIREGQGVGQAGLARGEAMLPVLSLLLSPASAEPPGGAVPALPSTQQSSLLLPTLYKEGDNVSLFPVTGTSPDCQDIPSSLESGLATLSSVCQTCRSLSCYSVSPERLSPSSASSFLTPVPAQPTLTSRSSQSPLLSHCLCICFCPFTVSSRSLLLCLLPPLPHSCSCALNPMEVFPKDP